MANDERVAALYERYGQPDNAPAAVKEHESVMDRLRNDLPVVPTLANGGLTRKIVEPEPVTPEVEAQPFQYPEVEPDDEPTPVQGTRMTFEEMKEHVLAKVSPEELLGLMISRLKTKDRVKLKEGRFTFPLDVVFFSANENQVVFYMDRDIAKEVKFEEGARYHLEHRDQTYAQVLFMGSIFPSPTFGYPLMLFLRDEEQHV
jgi:hypothetical protein